MSRFPVTHGQLVTLLAQARAEQRSADVVRRLEWFAHFAQHRSISKTCEHFGIARTTFYRWLKRFDPNNLDSLSDQPTITDDTQRDRFVEQHTFVEAPAQAEHTPQPETHTPVAAPLQRRTLSLGFVFALSVALLIGALLGKLPEIRLTANVSEPRNAISVPIDLNTAPGTDDVQVRIESQGTPLSGSVRDCTPSIEDGKPGWTCSLRIEP